MGGKEKRRRDRDSKSPTVGSSSGGSTAGATRNDGRADDTARKEKRPRKSASVKDGDGLGLVKTANSSRSGNDNAESKMPSSQRDRPQPSSTSGKQLSGEPNRAKAAGIVHDKNASAEQTPPRLKEALSSPQLEGHLEQNDSAPSWPRTLPSRQDLRRLTVGTEVEERRTLAALRDLEACLIEGGVAEAEQLSQQRKGTPLEVCCTHHDALSRGVVAQVSVLYSILQECTYHRLDVCPTPLSTIVILPNPRKRRLCILAILVIFHVRYHPSW